MNVTPLIPLDLKDTAQAAAAPAPASNQAMERFNAIMQASPSDTAGSVTPAAISDTTAPAMPHGPLSLGNQILGSLQKTAGEVQGQWTSISDQLGKTSTATPNIADLLQVQTQLLQVSIHYELVGKAIAKSTQNIDTMVRMQ